jgi:hypothetical protein
MRSWLEQMNAKIRSRKSGQSHRWTLTAVGSLLFCTIVLVGGVTRAGAEGVEPVVGAWKGKTAQGLTIFFGVREGRVITNVRLSYKDVICGKANIHERDVSLSVDESGDFAGIVYPANGGVELEGSFTGPRQVTGKIVAGESSGLPGCTGATVSFTAAPKP